MAAARGDRKPCTYEKCSGTMRFGREPAPESQTQTARGRTGWVCSTHAEHFQGSSDEPYGPRALIRM